MVPAAPPPPQRGGQGGGRKEIWTVLALTLVPCVTLETDALSHFGSQVPHLQMRQWDQMTQKVSPLILWGGPAFSPGLPSPRLTAEEQNLPLSQAVRSPNPVKSSRALGQVRATRAADGGTKEELEAKK